MHKKVCTKRSSFEKRKFDIKYYTEATTTIYYLLSYQEY